MIKEPIYAVRYYIEFTYSYPGMNINKGWKSSLKLDLAETTFDTSVSIIKVNRGGNGRDWFDAALKAYSLLGKIQDKIRVDIMNSSDKYNVNIRSLIDVFKYISIVQAKLLNIIETSSKNIHDYDFISAFTNIDLDSMNIDDRFFFDITVRAKLE